ncbi:uncharacterized protein LOC143547793 [Bidens hawaiensis]|uniref:uncharacterized protein LOC143547793 n=1 Tax=Bidens hawaiensis TaxID=980011 RepID=UPI00404B329D
MSNLNNQENNDEASTHRSNKDMSKPEQEIPAQYLVQIQEMIHNAMTPFVDEMKEGSQKHKIEHSNKSSRTHPYKKPSHHEESVHSSNAENKLNRKFKKQLVIQGSTFKNFKELGPKEFYGDKGAISAVRWIEEIESIVIISKCTEIEKIQYSSHNFKGEALEWWNTLIMSKGRETMYQMKWEEFKELVLRKFSPMHELDLIQIKFLKLKVEGTNLKEYNTKFHKYCRLVPHLVIPESNKVTRYIWGLPREIRDMVRSNLPQTADSAMELAGYLMNGLIRNQEEDKNDKGTKLRKRKQRKAKKRRKGLLNIQD